MTVLRYTCGVFRIILSKFQYMVFVVFQGIRIYIFWMNYSLHILIEDIYFGLAENITIRFVLPKSYLEAG
jgi:hypothetical protein